MTLSWFRRHMTPVASVALCVYWNAFLTTSIARAQQVDGEGPATTASASYSASSREALSQRASAAPQQSASWSSAAPPVAPKDTAPGDPADVEKALAALPAGGGGVSPQAAALPSGAAMQL